MTTDRQITYRKRLYKYELLHDWEFASEVEPPGATAAGVEGDWVVLEPGGLLRLRARYQWDGPSGPTIDTQTFMRASLLHDGLYQLLRAGKLGEPGRDEWERYRKLADRELKRVCRIDGMTWMRRAWTYRALRWFGRSAAMPSDGKNVRCAPKGCSITV